ncbi:hypothetical protein DXG03_006691 [Asterophora parasitica]|uniref:Uncharacterized protein n=1 Tax=Asterophora parasitica TaxID=117018 RepID=A0A9P7FZG8_9AGAR|nr:hypothetical protein DXG03_006691 [Asterophora parasitica]
MRRVATSKVEEPLTRVMEVVKGTVSGPSSSEKGKGVNPKNWRATGLPAKEMDVIAQQQELEGIAAAKAAKLLSSQEVLVLKMHADEDIEPKISGRGLQAKH